MMVCVMVLFVFEKFKLVGGMVGYNTGKIYFTYIKHFGLKLLIFRLSVTFDNTLEKHLKILKKA